MDSLNVFYQFLDNDLPFFSSSSNLELRSLGCGKLCASIPLDLVTMATVCDILDGPQHLGELILVPPVRQTTFLNNEEQVWETLVWLLTKTDELRHLERVSFGLDLWRAREFLSLLRRLPSVSKLEIRAPTTFDLDSQEEVFLRKMMNGVEAIIEDYPHLEEIIISRELHTVNETLQDLLDRMFDARSALPGNRIGYYRRARNLLYGTPHFLLPTS